MYVHIVQIYQMAHLWFVHIFVFMLYFNKKFKKQRFIWWLRQNLEMSSTHYPVVLSALSTAPGRGEADHFGGQHWDQSRYYDGIPSFTCINHGKIFKNL